jgi:ribokinase
MIACVGGDPLGQEAVLRLEREGIDVQRVVAHDCPTGVAFVVVARDGENQIVVTPGANGALLPEHVELDGFEGVLTQLEVPAETVAAAAERTTGLFCLNAAPAGAVPRRALERSDLVVVNRHELSAVGDPAALRLVAVTAGEEGAVLLERGREVARAVPPRIEAVDGTGAGDAFCAALFVGLLEGRSRAGALERACAAGALAASRFGAQPSLPTGAEIDGILGR